MADLGAATSFLGGLPEDQKRAFKGLLTYLLNNWRVGLPGHLKRAENMQWVQLDFITSATASQEFSVAHGLNVAPRVAFPCLDLTSSGTQMVPLYTTRPADTKRVYLRSSSTSAAGTVFVEARG